MFKSIRWRITIPYVVLTVLTIVGLGIYISNFVRDKYLNDLEKSLTAQGELIVDSLQNTSPLDFQDSGRLDNLAKHWADILNARVTLIDIKGIVQGESDEDRSQMENHLTRPEVQEALNLGVGSSIRQSKTIGIEFMYVALPVQVNGETIGIARIAIPINEINTNIQQLRKTIAIATVFAVLLTIVVSIFIAQRTARPLEELTQTVTKMTYQGLIHPPSTPAEYDEVSQLAEAFNTLVRQLRTQIRALETEQGKLASVLEEMTDGVIITNEDGIVELINPAAELLFDIDVSHIEGQSLIHALRHHQIVELWQRCIETGEEQALTLEIPRHRKFIQCIIIPLETALPGKQLLLFQDLTRMRRLETVRRDFISNISHELRTPLASLKALTETLQEGALDDPPAAKRFLERMETEVDALSHMVSELLELTRIESGQVPLEIVPVSPLKLLEDSIERLGVQAERAGLTIRLNCTKDLPDVLADPPRLGQALVNLVHNAIKFTLPRGEITLAAWQKADMVVFAVQDTGVGIPSDDLPRIFERFYKADQARSGGGTGLGLAITRHLVEAHGGRIWAESIENKGSTFYFSIPIDL